MKLGDTVVCSEGYTGIYVQPRGDKHQIMFSDKGDPVFEDMEIHEFEKSDKKPDAGLQENFSCLQVFFDAKDRNKIID